jgi:hypothetical protein
MITSVKPERMCASACIFILAAGVTRIPTPEGHVFIHRPRFDPTYFANLRPDQARLKYNVLLGELRKYYVDEINGSEEVFTLMISIPSDQARSLTYEELKHFGIAGDDPAWEEYTEAQQIKRFGPLRWPIIKKCIARKPELAPCLKQAYAEYPDDNPPFTITPAENK